MALSNTELARRAQELGARMCSAGFEETDNPYIGAGRPSLAQAWQSGYNVRRLVTAMEERDRANTGSQ
jgi:hypothetical protein